MDRNRKTRDEIRFVGANKELSVSSLWYEPEKQSYDKYLLAIEELLTESLKFFIVVFLTKVCNSNLQRNIEGFHFE